MKVVLFHKNCFDGLFSAFSFWKKYGAKDTIYIEVNYKPIQDMKPMEALDYIFESYIKNPSSVNPAHYVFEHGYVTKDEIKKMDLYLLDYSVPSEHLIEYSKLFRSITVLDHHKSALEDYSNKFTKTNDEFGWIYMSPAPNTTIIFSKNDSGARLTWRYLFGRFCDIPNYIEFISDYDLWTFKLANTRKFDYGLKLQDLSTFNMIETLMNYHLQTIVNEGEKYEKALMARVKKISRTNTIDIIVKIKGFDYKGCLINSFPDMRNELCNFKIDEGYDIAISYNFSNRGDVSCSVRSKKDVDSSLLSEMFGGGGHINSSACAISIDQFYDILDKKHIIVTKKNSFDLPGSIRWLCSLPLRIFKKAIGVLS